MPYLIDGHNLIPKVQGLNLADLDDEVALLEIVQRFCRNRRQKAEVYFDKAAPGQGKARKVGLVTAHFVHSSSDADTAIRHRLKSLGRQARNWKVVSSDRQVQAEAMAAHVEVIPAEEFARLLLENQPVGANTPSDERVGLSKSEVDEWLKLFDQS